MRHAEVEADHSVLSNGMLVQNVCVVCLRRRQKMRLYVLMGGEAKMCKRECRPPYEEGGEPLAGKQENEAMKGH